MFNANPRVLISGCAEEVLDLVSRSDFTKIHVDISWWPRSRSSMLLLRKFLPQAKKVENYTEYLDVLCPPFPVHKVFPEQCTNERVQIAVNTFPTEWISETLHWERNLAAQQGRKFNPIYQLFAALYLAGAVQTLAEEKPDVLLIWGGRRTRDAARVVVARALGVPILFAERGAFPKSVFLSATPIGPAMTQMKSGKDTLLLVPDHAVEKKDVDKLIAQYLANDQSAWEQPSRQNGQVLRRRWKIPDDYRIIFYAAQRPVDANTLFHSPHFSSNGAFVRYVISAMHGLEKIALVVKPHPKESTSSDQEIIDEVDAARQTGMLAICDRNVNIKDAINEAAVVASINSTTGFEALLHNVPVVVGGEAYYSQHGFTFDVRSADDPVEIARLRAFLKNPEFPVSQRDKFTEFLQQLFSKNLYFLNPNEGMNGPNDFISTIERTVTHESEINSYAIPAETVEQSRALLRDFSAFRLPNSVVGTLRNYLRRKRRKREV